jgi:hypothetical protein
MLGEEDELVLPEGRIVTVGLVEGDGDLELDVDLEELIVSVALLEWPEENVEVSELLGAFVEEAEELIDLVALTDTVDLEELVVERLLLRDLVVVALADSVLDDVIVSEDFVVELELLVSEGDLVLETECDAVLELVDECVIVTEFDDDLLDDDDLVEVLVEEVDAVEDLLLVVVRVDELLTVLVVVMADVLVVLTLLVEVNDTAEVFEAVSVPLIVFEAETLIVGLEVVVEVKVLKLVFETLDEADGDLDIVVVLLELELTVGVKLSRGLRVEVADLVEVFEEDELIDALLEAVVVLEAVGVFVSLADRLDDLVAEVLRVAETLVDDERVFDEETDELLVALDVLELEELPICVREDDEVLVSNELLLEVLEADDVLVSLAETLELTEDFVVLVVVKLGGGVLDGRELLVEVLVAVDVKVVNAAIFAKFLS